MVREGGADIDPSARFICESGECLLGDPSGYGCLNVQHKGMSFK